MEGQGRVRRVVTGHDATGRAIVVSDGLAPAVHTNPMRPGHWSVDIWRTEAAPARIEKMAADPTPGPRKQMPPKRGTVVRIADFAPESEALRALDPDSAKKVFAAMGNESASTFRPGGRHPMMHRTETIDYAIVLSGELTMVLDDTDVVLREGDVVIQCGTNHAWSNRSGKPARIAFVLVDGKFDSELETTLENG
ncbi:MAG: cupin domain-containing protein [Betaproteobacteria bacterium]|nr:MAG: cupin domain-containing protein [Betaproteobacteria bacterium]